MSKIDLFRDGKHIGTIDNKMKELNKHIVIVDISYIAKLEEANIPYSQFQEDFYICTRGKKKKKFNEDQVKVIKKDLDNGLSIRKCANKYKCSTNLIQSIKSGKYLSE